MDAKEAKKRAAEISEDLEGIAGQLPMERVVRKHRDFFDELRDMGATWGQIAKLMAEAGLRRADGTPLSERHWSAMYSRASRSNKVAPSAKKQRNGLPQKAHKPEGSVRPEASESPQRNQLIRRLMNRAKNVRS